MKSLRSFLMSVLCLIAVGCGGTEDFTAPEVGTTESSLTTYALLPSSGSDTQSLAANPGNNNVLIMSSLTAGSWHFTANGSPGSYGSCAQGSGSELTTGFVVWTYWRDSSNPSDPWHWWPGGGQVCWPSSPWINTTLYSGSKWIQYKFVFENFTSFGQTVHAHFTKL